MYTEKCSSQKTGDESIQKPIIYSQEALILDACSGCKSAELIFLVQGSGKSVGVKLCSNINLMSSFKTIKTKVNRSSSLPKPTFIPHFLWIAEGRRGLWCKGRYGTTIVKVSCWDTYIIFFELNLKDRKLSKYSSYELLAQPLGELRILKKLWVSSFSFFPQVSSCLKSPEIRWKPNLLKTLH